MHDCHRSFIILALLAALALPFSASSQSATRKQMQQKLDRIILTRIVFEETRVADVLRTLRDRVREVDLDDDRPFNLVIRAKKEALDGLVSLDMENIPAGEAIRYVCMVAGLRYVVEPHAVVILDEAATAERMETRIYHIDPSVIDKKKSDKLEFNKK